MIFCSATATAMFFVLWPSVGENSNLSFESRVEPADGQRGSANVNMDPPKYSAENREVLVG